MAREEIVGRPRITDHKVRAGKHVADRFFRRHLHVFLQRCVERHQFAGMYQTEAVHPLCCDQGFQQDNGICVDE